MGNRVKDDGCPIPGFGRGFGEVKVVQRGDGSVHVTHDTGCLALKPKHAKRLAKQILALLEDFQ